MKIIIQFSDASDFRKRLKETDEDIFLLIIREENSKIVLKQAVNPKGEVNKEYVCNKIDESEKINVEIIGHSSTGGKQIQADKTSNYPNLHFVCIDILAIWLEDELLKNNIVRATISLLSCQAARGTPKYPALSAQLFELFNNKPEKVTARHGYVFIEAKIYSLGGFDTALKVLNNRILSNAPETIWKKPLSLFFGIINFLYQPNKNTSLNEHVVYYQGMDGKTRVIDKHLYDVYEIIKRKIITTPNGLPKEIKELYEKKPLEDFSEKEFIKIAKYGAQENIKEKVHLKSKVILSSACKIKKAILANTNIDTFKKKNELLKSIDLLKVNVTLKDKTIEELLDSTKVFIEYRQSRNYSIDEFFDFIDALQHAVQPKSKLEYQKAMETLVLFLVEMRSSKKTKSDTKHRLGATSIDFKDPSFYQSIEQVTKTKNQDFSKKINDFLEKFDNKYSSKAIELEKKAENDRFKFNVLCSVVTVLSAASIIAISRNQYKF